MWPVSRRLRWSAFENNINAIVAEKVNYRGTQSQKCVVDGRSANSGEMVFGRRP